MSERIYILLVVCMQLGILIEYDPEDNSLNCSGLAHCDHPELLQSVVEFGSPLVQLLSHMSHAEAILTFPERKGRSWR